MEKTNTSCNVRDTYVCQYLGTEGCERCTLNAGGIRAYQRQELLEHWEVALSNLPDGVDHLHDTDKCQFCRDVDKQPADGYAITEFAHREPETQKGMIMGLGPKVKVEAGTILQLPVSICKDCRKRLRMPVIIPWIGMGIGCALAFILLALNSVLKLVPMQETLWPLVFFVALLLGGYAVGAVFARRYIARNEGLTWYNALQTPVGREMGAMGWFGFREDKGRSHFKFSKEKPRKGFRIMPEGYVRPVKEEKPGY